MHPIKAVEHIRSKLLIYGADLLPTSQNYLELEIRRPFSPSVPILRYIRKYNWTLIRAATSTLILPPIYASA